MKKNQFESFHWHDATLTKIVIDRSNPGRKDEIELHIIWPNGKKNKMIFKKVYFAKLDLNFGVIALESIADANIISNEDIELISFKNIWRNHFEGIEQLTGFEITTNSTAGKIRIYAMSFVLNNLL